MLGSALASGLSLDGKLFIQEQTSLSRGTWGVGKGNAFPVWGCQGGGACLVEGVQLQLRKKWRASL